ncbi:ankyrin repeat domain-containing protein 49 isoform X2 [Carettochelys insculpta]|uniref:ankyrin repeat domain-containing protein 49 isoform X2 n=1 Tax=Carettochelys insculpta TaxID=44489 RepID=UPI003EB7B0D7
MNESRKPDVKNTDNSKDDQEELLEFTENFNQLELLETHRHLIPVGTQSLWSGESDEEDEEEEKSEEWYQMQEKKMENNPENLLLWASEKNRLSTVHRLLSQKLAPVNVQDEDRYTPLHRAAYGGHLDVVRELVAQGADVHALTVDGWTPLHSALALEGIWSVKRNFSIGSLKPISQNRNSLLSQPKYYSRHGGIRR